MLTIKYHSSFKKDFKRIVKRGYDIKLMEAIIRKLANGEPLPEKNKDHELVGDYVGCRECHITPIGFSYMKSKGLQSNRCKDAKYFFIPQHVEYYSF